MKTNNCIKNLLKMICILQKNSEDIVTNDISCTKVFLGPNINNLCYNTRVITLYGKNGELLNISYNDNSLLSTSSTFRVIEVKDDSCTLLILRNNEGSYVSTGQTFTLNIGCICAVKCIGVVVINNL